MKKRDFIYLGVIAVLLIGNFFQIKHAERERLARLLDFANSNTVIAQKQGEISIRDSLISDIRQQRQEDSLKNSVSQRALKQRVATLTAEIDKLPQTIVYNPDSATVDSLRVAFTLKDEVINTQALMIITLETEKDGLFQSFNKEIGLLEEQRAAQVDISNSLQTQIVDEQGRTRKQVRAKKVWRFVAGVGAAAVGVLLLSPK